MINRCLAWTWLLLLQAVPVQATSRAYFIRTLNNAGVSVVERSRCGDARNNVAAYYLDRNQICISTRLTPTMADLDEALTHEAVHAIQDCLAGQHNGRLTTLSASVGQTTRPFERWLAPGQLAFIQSNYSPRDWDIEIEAYALQNRPGDVVKLLSAACS